MPDKQSVYGLFMCSKKQYSARKRALFTKYQLSPGQPRLLKFIKQHEGCSQKELADQCLIEQATATSILTSLEKQGLISRQSCQTDKRKMKLFLTDLGQEKAAIVTELFEELEETSLKGFSEEEQAQFKQYLLRLYENLAQES